MEVRKERIVAYCLGIILLVIGIVSYAAFPERSPEEPIRIILKSAAGNVLLDMKEHHSPEGYSYDCVDCHHEIEEPDERPTLCRECHLLEKEESEAEINTEDAFHDICIPCHEDDGIAPVLCETCHKMG